MAKNKDASSFFKGESDDDDFFRDSLNGFSALGKIFDVAKDEKSAGVEKPRADIPKTPPAAQSRRTPVRESEHVSMLSELDLKQKALDAKVNALINELDEKNRQIAELEYKLAQQINKSYTHTQSSRAFEQSYSEMHKREILDHILQDIKGLYSSVSTRAKVVEEREYQILLKMVELEERRRALSDKHQRRKSAYGARLSPYEEISEQKLLPSDNPALSKQINRSIDKVEHQIKTPYIALAENIEDIRPAIMAAPEPEVEKYEKPRAYTPSQRVQSLRQALEKETEGLEIFEKRADKAPRSAGERKDAVHRAVSEKQQAVSHPSKEIQHEFNQAKLALQKRRLEELQKQNGKRPQALKQDGKRPADDIEMDSLLDEINQVLGEQKNIESQIADALKKDDVRQIKPSAAQSPPEPAPQPAQERPPARENVTSDTVELANDEMSLLSSLLDDL